MPAAETHSPNSYFPQVLFETWDFTISDWIHCWCVASLVPALGSPHLVAEPSFLTNSAALNSILSENSQNDSSSAFTPEREIYGTASF